MNSEYTREERERLGLDTENGGRYFSSYDLPADARASAEELYQEMFAPTCGWLNLMAGAWSESFGFDTGG